MPKKTQQKEEALVRMLAYALGVAPWEFGLAPDAEGWVAVKELIKAFGQEEGWRFVRRSMVMDAAVRLAPDALELNEKAIRARERRYDPAQLALETPAHLYFGARMQGWAVIRKKGLAGRSGAPLMLAVSEQTALRLAERRGPDPVLVTVQAHQAAEQGVVFSAWGPELFFCDWLPVGVLMGPPVPEEALAKKPAKTPKERSAEPQMPAADQVPGSFLVDVDDLEKPYKRKGIKKDIAWKRDRRRDRRRGK
jgi:putative RNA 2'-phosphotransferase